LVGVEACVFWRAPVQLLKLSLELKALKALQAVSGRIRPLFALSVVAWGG